MKNRKYSIVILLFIATLLNLQSCTDNFEEYNRNPYAVTDDLKKADWLHLRAYFPQIQQSIYYNNSGGNWEFQIAQNLNADLFGGYLTPPNPFNNDKNNMNYYMMEGWNEHAFKLYNNNIMKPWFNLKELTLDKQEYLDIYAAALILKVAGMHRSTDLYGPIPYSKYGLGGVMASYDSQEAVYNQFFKELDEAIKYLDAHLKGENAGVNSLGNSDLIYKGNYENWIKWANSLRLRLAVRISKVAPEKAKAEAEKAMANPYGVLEANNQNVTVPTNKMGNPLTIIAYAYNDTRMSADMESILTGYEDPRLPKYFAPATDTDPNINGKYRGVRQGISVVSKDIRVGYSNVSELYSLANQFSTPVVLMTAAEVYFLRAEGALRNWNNMGGTAKKLYNKGIETSMGQWSAAGASDYITNNTKTPADYVDYKERSYDVAAASKVTIAWNDNESNEIKLEKIITQKWIAMFPDGNEAWAEQRRTGYPKLLPISVNNSSGDIDSDIRIRRLRFPESERNNNAEAVKKATETLNGPDSAGTKLWWDTNAGSSNF